MNARNKTDCKYSSMYLNEKDPARSTPLQAIDENHRRKVTYKVINMMGNPNYNYDILSHKKK